MRLPKAWHGTHGTARYTHLPIQYHRRLRRAARARGAAPPRPAPQRPLNPPCRRRRRPAARPARARPFCAARLLLYMTYRQFQRSALRTGRRALVHTSACHLHWRRAARPVCMHATATATATAPASCLYCDAWRPHLSGAAGACSGTRLDRGQATVWLVHPLSCASRDTPFTARPKDSAAPTSARRRPPVLSARAASAGGWPLPARPARARAPSMTGALLFFAQLRLERGPGARVAPSWWACGASWSPTATPGSTRAALCVSRVQEGPCAQRR